MFFSLFFLKIFGLATAVTIPSSSLIDKNENNRHLKSRLAITGYSLPAGNDLVRALSIDTTRAGFTYGTDPAGTDVYYPSGVLGTARTTLDLVKLEVDTTAHLARVEADTLAATAAINAVSSTELNMLVHAPFLHQYECRTKDYDADLRLEG